MTRLRGSFVVLVVLLGATGASAQVGSTAQISGVVSDASGGVLPGADVTAIQTETGFKRSGVTDANGSYTLSNLPIGPYRLETTLQGFRTMVRTGIVLQVNANPVINVTLPLGELSEAITVEAAAPLIETRSLSIGQIIENEQIEELPLNGRNPTELIALAGASVPQGGASSRSMQGANGGQAIAVAGGQSFGVAYLLDGAMHNNPYDNLNLPLPFPDALQEFRVETSSTNANNGMHSGASVNSVTKSGTNLFHGDLFEFVRDARFNATDPFTVLTNSDGSRVDDGLNRNQFGGTLGGPIRPDRVFFFFGFQGTRTRERPATDFDFVPTAQMLAGDFTTVASAQCQATGARTLSAPFIGNRIDPRLFSPAALRIAEKLPKTTDPCGRIDYSTAEHQDDRQYIGKVDVQVSPNHSVFGRYILTTMFVPPPQSLTGNILTSTSGGRDNIAHSLTIGDTRVLSNSTVNAIRFAYNKTDIHRTHSPLGFSIKDVGINAFSYLDDYMLLSVGGTGGGFNLGGGTENEATFDTPAYQITDDLTLIRGSHQFGLGGSLAYWKSLSLANVRSPGVYSFNGTVTGLGLSDFLTGNLQQLVQSAPNTLDMHQWYVGLYALDTWKLGSRATVNFGVRWEPFIAQQLENGAVYNFSMERFLNNQKTTVFSNAPAGLTYPGDPGFPNGNAGMHNKWLQFSPRVGFAWDPMGDGRMSVRTGYSLSYDFVNAQFHLNTAVAPPWGGELRIMFPQGGLDNPFVGTGQSNPFPITFDANAPFPINGPYLAIPPDLESPRQQSWNVSVERQIGNNLAVTASYLGTYSDRMWNVRSINYGVFLGTGPCTLQTPTGPQTFPVCSTQANVDARRKLRLLNFDQGKYYAGFEEHTALGEQKYNALLLRVTRRAANGVSVGANYTLSKCMGHPTQGGGTPNVNSGYTNPDDIDYDYGACGSDRRHIFNLTGTANSPEFDNRLLDTIASGWRLSAIFRATSGPPLTVTVTGDPARTGLGGQRANAVLDDPYLDRNSLTRYLNSAAFLQPAVGTYGQQERGWFSGVGSRNIDVSIVRSFRFAQSHRIEARVEAFNAFNWNRWNQPTTNLNSNQFGQITGSADPRVMQFAMKYSF
jgi:hypothetical protein